LDLQNNKVIGLHRGYDPKTNLNYGLILTEPLIEFEKNIKQIRKNKIYLILEVNENDINKDIYFLDNSFFNQKKALKKPHSFLSELNDSNVKVYINEKKINKYQKYFRPEAEGLYKIRLEIDIKLKFCQNMFEFCKNIKQIDLSGFDTSKVVDMSYMFKDCDKLEQLNLSYFSTEKVNNMDYMFYNCNSLKRLNLLFFDYKKCHSNGKYVF
jgi:surface protein